MLDHCVPGMVARLPLRKAKIPKKYDMVLNKKEIIAPGASVKCERHNEHGSRQGN